MNKLTDEQLQEFPGWIWDAYGEAWRDADWAEYIGASKENTEKWVVIRLVHELARALRPQACGHPGACVVSAPSAPGMVTTCHCGWCAESDHLRDQIKFLQMGMSEAATVRTVLVEEIERLEAERDDLRKKLKAAEGLAEALESVGFGTERRRQLALAAWKEADD